MPTSMQLKSIPDHFVASRIYILPGFTSYPDESTSKQIFFNSEDKIFSCEILVYVCD